MRRSIAHGPRRGTVLPLLAITITALVMMIALAIDIGMLAVARTRAQNAADLAALAGARLLNGDTTSSSNLNNVTNAETMANARVNDMANRGFSKDANGNLIPYTVNLRHGVYTYDSGVQRFKPSFPGSPGTEAWSVMEVSVRGAMNTYFGRVFGINSFNFASTATAAHRPRDVALILDYSGSMRFGSETAFYQGGYDDIRGSLNPDPVYPKFGHYYAMSQRTVATSTTQPSSNGTGYNPMYRPIMFVDSGGEAHAANNLTIATAGGDPIVRDFLCKVGSSYVNAFYNPQSDSSWDLSKTPTAMPAPANFQDMSDSPRAYVGDKWPRKSKATSGNNWAAHVEEYLFGTNNNSAYNVDNHNKYVASSGPNFDDQNPDNGSGGYGVQFKGYSMGPGYYGKTFWIWPPDPRRPRSNNGHPDHVPGDWRKRYFKYGESFATTSLRNQPLDDNSVLFDSSGYIRQPSATGYRINYAAILTWIKIGPQVLPPNLRAGRVLYYDSIPDDVPNSGGTLDQIFWREYIHYVLGVDSSREGTRTMNGRETSGWGTVKITSRSALLGGRSTTNSTVPYMHYNDNPIRQRMQFWFGPLTMLMFLTEDNENNDNMWPGTCHESQCWQLKAGVRSALEDIRLNHPNDWAALIFFSTESGFSTPRVQMSRKYTRMKNALFFPFSLLTDSGLTSSPVEIRPYDSSFSYTGGGNIPNARGGTCPQMGFKVAYNEFSSASGYYGRRGAAKVCILETDGVPNNSCGGSFNNSGGPYRSYYNTSGLGSTTWEGNNDSGATDPAVAAVTQITALDSASNPGYSTQRTPARVHTIGFGDIFESGSARRTDALNFLLRCQVAGRTSASGASSIESYKIVTGDATQRIEKLRQALERIMQSGVQVTLIQ